MEAIKMKIIKTQKFLGCQKSKRFLSKYLFGFGILFLISLVFLVGCTNQSAKQEITNFEQCAAAGNPVMESFPRQCRIGDNTFTEQIVGGDRDEHGCIGSAGYSWCESKQKCIRVWEENCSEATNEINVHVCTAQESQAKACTMEYSPVCGEILLNTGKRIYQTFGNRCSACAAMKVVSYIQGECPPEKTVELCSDFKGNYMTLDEAKDIAKSSECGNNLVVDCTCPLGYRKEGDICNPNCYYLTPRCLAPSLQCEKTYVCNEGTGTYWININLTKKGCSPACVINLETKTAEINWRCTGLITE
jgi:hypothetical protein